MFLQRVLSVSRRVARTNVRCLSGSAVKRDTFTIQDEEDFKTKVLANAEPVVVDFSATWCGPCKMLTPRLEAAIAATGGQVHLAIVDIDELGDLAMDHGVQAVPTVLAMKGGQQVDKFVGLLDEDKLSAFINQLKDN
eukprot:snap_masked-scaffold871_size86487-processed-gene-0.8 protein:Tk08311 transcript:snap_masked-scaffold871_size86487-processed-gene-0.8-mRNA-1 annotation:"thioredoxin 2"